jgi:hypothetical protein
MAKQIDKQLVYKKVISFNLIQKESLVKLKEYDVNINEFIRAAVREKIKRDWKNIKERKLKASMPF